MLSPVTICAFGAAACNKSSLRFFPATESFELREIAKTLSTAILQGFQYSPFCIEVKNR